MKQSLQMALAWLILAASAAAQQTGPGSTSPESTTKARTFSGRVVDGLGRPVPGVKVTVEPFGDAEKKAPETILRTDSDGRYSGTLPANSDGDLGFEREGHSDLVTEADSGSVIV